MTIRKLTKEEKAQAMEEMLNKYINDNAVTITEVKGKDKNGHLMLGKTETSEDYY